VPGKFPQFWHECFFPIIFINHHIARLCIMRSVYTRFSGTWLWECRQ
jgi:hypothetical protein